MSIPKEKVSASSGVGGAKTNEVINTYDATGRLQKTELDDDGTGPVERTYTNDYTSDGIRVVQTEQIGGGAPTHHKSLFERQPHSLPRGTSPVSSNRGMTSLTRTTNTQLDLAKLQAIATSSFPANSRQHSPL